MDARKAHEREVDAVNGLQEARTILTALDELRWSNVQSKGSIHTECLKAKKIINKCFLIFLDNLLFHST